MGFMQDASAQSVSDFLGSSARWFCPPFVAAVSAVVLAQQQQDIDAQIRHTFQVNDELERIQTLMTDAESGQRGYLLTDRFSYLDPYNFAKHGLPNELNALRSELAGNSSLAELDELRTTVSKKLAELQSTIDLRSANKPDAALAIVNNDSGKALMDRIRDILADMHATQEKLLENRSVEAAQLNRSRGTVSCSPAFCSSLCSELGHCSKIAAA